MSLQVHIPVESFFTLYARGNIEAHATVPGLGTFFSFYSTVVLFYKYPRHRRAYIVRNASDMRYGRATALPNVKEPVVILLRVRGRRVDLLRRAYFNLERINGLEVYDFAPIFWQKVGCLIDGWDGRRNRATKENLAWLSKRYKAERRIKEVSHALASE